MAAEDGREYYAVSSEFDPDRAGSWVRKNVLPKLPSPSSKVWRSRRQIRSELEDFFNIDGDEPIELWAWVGAYDHVVLCQLWGRWPTCHRRCRASPGNCDSSGRTAAARGCHRGRAMPTTRWWMRDTTWTATG